MDFQHNGNLEQDPLTALMGGRTQFTSIVATVTGVESIEHPLEPGTTVECFVVETAPHSCRAWVDGDGHVLVQQVDMPGLGLITVRQEPFDELQRERARARIITRSNGGGEVEPVLPGDN